jgi:hypothetical protein
MERLKQSHNFCENEIRQNIRNFAFFAQTVWDTKYIYRVAAIFPYCFQSFIVPLKNNLFYKFFSRKTFSAICRNIIKNKQSHSGKDESTGRRIAAGTVSRRCAGHTMIVIKSFWKHQQEHCFVLQNGKRKFDKFMRNWCRRMHIDSWKSPLDLLAGWHPC